MKWTTLGLALGAVAALAGCSVGGGPGRTVVQGAHGSSQSKNVSAETVRRSAAYQAYGWELIQAIESGDLQRVYDVYERHIAYLKTLSPRVIPAENACARQQGVLLCRMGDWAGARQKFQASTDPVRDLGRMQPNLLYWIREASRRTGDAAGVAAVRALAAGLSVRVQEGFSESGAELMGSGLTADEVMDFAIGLRFLQIGSVGEDQERGQAYLRQVADKHPTNGFVNFGAVNNIGRHPNKMLYGRRAYRYGSQAMRDEMMRVTSSSVYYIANVEAKAMGHPYEMRLFRTYINRADGTVDYVDP